MLIAQLTDMHVRPVGIACNRVSETNMFFERALRKLASLSPAPDLTLITGDLTECGLIEEYENFAAILRRYPVGPVYVIPGNHDRRENLQSVLAHLPGIMASPDYIQYVIEDHPARIVMLDTVVPGENHGHLSEEQLAWLDRTLAAAPERPTLIGMHHPPFPSGIQHMDNIALLNATAFQAVIARHRQVSRIICGHHHRAITGVCAHAVASVAPSVAHQVELSLDPAFPGAFNFEPPAFQLHLWQQASFTSHLVYVETFPGPFSFQTET